METKSYISRVYNIFIDFFGEERVDLQNDNTIIIHFPKVTITNEHDRSVDITNLWAKVLLNIDGTISGTFSLLRTEYTILHFNAGYSHSHLRRRENESFLHWDTPCIGSGPIKNTIANLGREFSEELWQLFCLELSKYVTVESLEGVPYNKLEFIGKTTESLRAHIYIYNINMFTGTSCLEGAILGSFVPYIFKKRPFTFNYANGCYNIAKSDRDICLILSNLFIKWYNSLSENEQPSLQSLYDNSILTDVKLDSSGNFVPIFKHSSTKANDRFGVIGRQVFTFKDNPIFLQLISSEVLMDEEDPGVITILSTNMVTAIVLKITTILNYRYGQERKETDDSSTSREIIRYI